MPTLPTGCCWPAPMPTCRSTGASRFFTLSHAPGRRGRPAVAPDERASLLQRGVPRRCPGSPRQPGPELLGGWAAARTTLSHERGLAAGLFGSLPPAGEGRTREEAAAEASQYLRTYEWYPVAGGRHRRRGARVCARAVDRRWDRRDPAGHHRRAGPRPSQRALPRRRHPAPARVHQPPSPAVILDEGP